MHISELLSWKLKIITQHDDSYAILYLIGVDSSKEKNQIKI